LPSKIRNPRRAMSKSFRSSNSPGASAGAAGSAFSALRIKILAFAFPRGVGSIAGLMTKPLALLFYERLMPGSQLANRLQDLGYRVQTVAEPSLLAATAAREKPMVMLLDLVTNRANLCAIIKEMREGQETGHIPAVVFAGLKEQRLRDDAAKSGAALVALDDALLPQLPQLLEHVLRVE